MALGPIPSGPRDRAHSVYLPAVRRATIPCTRADRLRPTCHGSEPMKKILLAYDGGEPARRALETAGELARAFHAPVSVVSVVPEGAGRPVGDPREDASAHARELQEAKRLLAEMGLEVEPVSYTHLT